MLPLYAILRFRRRVFIRYYMMLHASATAIFAAFRCFADTLCVDDAI